MFVFIEHLCMFYTPLTLGNCYDPGLKVYVIVHESCPFWSFYTQNIYSVLFWLTLSSCTLATFFGLFTLQIRMRLLVRGLFESIRYASISDPNCTQVFFLYLQLTLKSTKGSKKTTHLNQNLKFLGSLFLKQYVTNFR